MKEFIRYVTLSILGTLGVSCYILADTFFIAKGLGSAGLTALNLAIPVYNFIFGLGMMFGMGGAIKFSISKGMKHEKEGDTVYSNAVLLTLGGALLFVLTGIFGAEKLAALLGAEGEILQLTTTYLRWLLIFAPAFMMNAALQCFVRNDDAPNLVMFAMLIGSFSNIILDYIFIFEMQMGIFGAIFATGLSPVISMLVMLPHWLKKRNTFHLIKARISGKLTGQMVSLGFPSLLGQVSGGIVMIIFNMRILSLEGNVGVAAYGVVANISIVVTSLLTGLAQGMQPLISTYYGEGKKEKIGQIKNYGYATMAVLSVLIYAGLFMFAPQVTAAFNGEGNRVLQRIAETGLKLYFISNIFVGLNTIEAMVLAATERALPAHILSLLRGFVLVIPLALAMSSLWGMTGIWLSFPVTEAVTSIFGIVLQRAELRREK